MTKTQALELCIQTMEDLRDNLHLEAALNPIIEQAKTASDWISVEDRLPQCGVSVNVYVKPQSGEPYILVNELINATATAQEFMWRYAIGPWNSKITHWRMITTPIED